MKVPNLYALARLIVDRTQRQSWPAVALLVRNVYGGHRWGPEGSLDAHHTGWVPEMLHAELARAGFDVISDDESLNNLVECKRR